MWNIATEIKGQFGEIQTDKQKERGIDMSCLVLSCLSFLSHFLLSYVKGNTQSVHEEAISRLTATYLQKEVRRVLSC